MWLGQGREKKKDLVCLASVMPGRLHLSPIQYSIWDPPKELDVWEAGFKIARTGKPLPQYINGLTVQINKLMLMRVG